MSDTIAVIVSAKRTPVGRAIKGSLRDTRPDTLAAVAIKAVMDESGVDPSLVEDVLLGCAMPEAEQGLNVARIASFAAGLPYTAAAVTINRFCSSGVQAIAMAAERIMAGSIDVAIAGGTESMTMVPMGGHKYSVNPELHDRYPEAYASMGVTAENVARKFKIAREEQDAFAVASHQKAAAAIEAHRFDDELVPVETKLYDEARAAFAPLSFGQDELVRPATTTELLAKLPTVFSMGPGASVTAGNSSPLSDGAAAALLMSGEKAESLGLEPLGVFRGFQAVGVPPELMGIGPVAAVPKLLAKAGLSIQDIDLFELNEAFASQSIYCQRELKIPSEKLNVNGGAIALGHPLGATGAKLVATALHELRRRKGRFAVVTMCIGGGMGAAALFERA